MGTAVIIDLVAIFFSKQDRHWLAPLGTEHPGAGQRLYSFTLLAPAAASFPEVIVSSQELSFIDKRRNIKFHPFVFRLWPKERSSYSHSQIPQRPLWISNTAVCIVFGLSGVAPSTGYLDNGFRRPRYTAGWWNL